MISGGIWVVSVDASVDRVPSEPESCSLRPVQPNVSVQVSNNTTSKHGAKDERTSIGQVHVGFGGLHSRV